MLSTSYQNEDNKYLMFNNIFTTTTKKHYKLRTGNITSLEDIIHIDR